MKAQSRLSFVLVVICALAASPTRAEQQDLLPLGVYGVVDGRVDSLYADPNDFVIVLDVTGPCGSTSYNVKRSKVNFHELVKAAFAAYAQSAYVFAGEYRGGVMRLYVESCDGVRNILSHGAVL